MITIRTTYLIVSIRILIFIITFLLTKLLASLFNNEINLELFVSIGILVAFFSLLTIFLVKIFDNRYIFYLQGIFDILITIFLIVNTDYLDSPYLLFFAIIILYLGFYEGYKGGIVGLLLVIISLSLLAIVNNELFVMRYYNFRYFMLIMGYIFSFIVMLLLVIILHKKYMSQLLESERFKLRLSKLENLHKLILESVDFGIILLDKMGIVVSLNDTGKKILDEDDNLLGKPLFERYLFANEDGLTIIKERYVGYKIKDFKDDKGDVQGKLIIFQDVTEKDILKKKLEEERRLADMGRFSALIAHEIKNPLGAIKGAIQILAKKISENDKIIRIVEREINRLDLFLGNMLILSKNRTENIENLNVKQLIDDFMYYLDISNIFESIKILNQVDDKLQIKITEDEFKQILWNLILNSFEARIDASVKFYNVDNILYYEDNGPGIDDEQISNLGRPFFTTKKSGTGLGFYTIVKICEKRGIKLKVYSNSEFNGFKVEFNQNIC
ncbi:MAG: hypothetical protein K6348_05025 [Deferribacterales bacterium]